MMSIAKYVSAGTRRRAISPLWHIFDKWLNVSFCRLLAAECLLILQHGDNNGEHIKTGKPLHLSLNKLMIYTDVPLQLMNSNFHVL